MNPRREFRQKLLYGSITHFWNRRSYRKFIWLLGTQSKWSSILPVKDKYGRICQLLVPLNYRHGSDYFLCPLVEDYSLDGTWDVCRLAPLPRCRLIVSSSSLLGDILMGTEVYRPSRPHARIPFVLVSTVFTMTLSAAWISCGRGQMSSVCPITRT